MGVAFRQLSVLLLDLNNVVVLPPLAALVRAIRAGATSQPALDDRGAIRGLAGILERLQGRVKLGVVTTERRSAAMAALAHLAPGTTFDVIITADDVERTNPHPDALLEALSRLQTRPSRFVAYVGGDNSAIEAAYHAGVRPVRAMWSHWAVDFTARPNGTWRPDDYFELPDGLALRGHDPFPEILLWHPADLTRLVRDPDPYLPLMEQAQGFNLGVLPFVRHVEGQSLSGIALGRYFKRRGATLKHHRRHHLSLAVRKKLEVAEFHPPDPWVWRLTQVLRWLQHDYGAIVLTSVPDKPGKDPRMTRLLKLLEPRLYSKRDPLDVRTDVLVASEAALDTKHVRGGERVQAVRSGLGGQGRLNGEVVVLLDDVLTSGATMRVASELLLEAGASRVLPVAIAATVSAFSFDVDPLAKTCPKCGGRMEITENRTSGLEFYGCVNHRHCGHAEAIA